MGKTLFDNGVAHTRPFREPDNPRENMEPSDLEPDDARQFIIDLMSAVYDRMRELPDDDFEKPDRFNHIPPMEKAKQFYGNDTIQLLSGIEAALREWDESGQGTGELKEQYGGEFVRGVEIGERLAVYQGSDFSFSTGEDDPDESESKFTFST